MRYRLNFSRSSVDKHKRHAIRRYTGLTYLLVLLFSGYVLFQIYTTQRFMAGVYQERVEQIEKRIGQIEPRALFLEKMIAQKNRLGNLASLYVQENTRPSVWYARLFDLARLLPPELVVSRITFAPASGPGGAGPELTVDGQMIIKGGEQNVFAVDDFRAALAESIPSTFTYPRLKVEKNRIFKEEDNLKLIFSLGFYR
ncbi:MAG: hypothetical protein ACE5LH_05135 [Fidelibacterota bacterium]